MLKAKEQLGLRIRYLRRQKGFSQEELAYHSEVNKNYISDLERGQRNPTLEILSRIAVGLDVTLSELFKGIVEYF